MMKHNNGMMPKTMAFVQWEPLIAHYLQIKRQFFYKKYLKLFGTLNELLQKVKKN